MSQVENKNNNHKTFSFHVKMALATTTQNVGRKMVKTWGLQGIMISRSFQTSSVQRFVKMQWPKVWPEHVADGKDPNSEVKMRPGILKHIFPIPYREKDDDPLH
mgnify:FL=1